MTFAPDSATSYGMVAGGRQRRNPRAVRCYRLRRLKKMDSPILGLEMSIYGPNYVAGTQSRKKHRTMVKALALPSTIQRRRWV